MKRRLMSIWAMLTLRYIDVTNVTKAEHLEVKTINDNTESMAEALGITEERSDELVKMSVKHFRATNKMSNCMELISKECKHANELAYAIHAVTDYRNHVSSPMGSILGMIMSKGRPGSKD